MRNILIVFLLSVLFACSQAPAPKQQAAQQQNTVEQGAFFRFSEAAAVPPLQEAGNWCRLNFDEAVLINADPANVNRKFFRLDDGAVLRTVVRQGNAANFFFVRKSAEKTVEIFTGMNFPECLSGRGNYSNGPGAAMLTYDNRKSIRYNMEAQHNEHGLFVILEFPENTQYGLTVHRCEGCR